MSTICSALAPALLLGSLGGSALAQDILYEHTFNNAGSWKNLQVSALADVDGDGVADFAVGAPGDGRGKVRVISGASQAVIHTFVGDAETYQLGDCLADIGDVDLDGVTDLAVSANSAVRVFSLGTGQALYTVLGSWSDRFGYAVCAAGDVNGDGRADFAVGAPQVYVWGGGDIFHISIVGPGFVQVLSGLDGTLLRTMTGPAGQTGFGGSIANGGRLDGDGLDDLLVSHFLVPFVPGGNFMVRGFSGASGALLVQAPTLYGANVAALGDVDVDGIDDFVVGERGSGVRAISGNAGTTLYTGTGIGQYDHFGAALSRIGDLDGDGFPELLVGAPQPMLYSPYGNVPVGPGYARVLSGRTGVGVVTLVGNVANQGLGTAVSALGDIDADGKQEFLVTTLRDGGDLARARVYSGRFGFSTPTNFCVGDFNSALTNAAIGFIGSTSLSANQLTMTLSGAVPGQQGVLFCGTSASAARFDPLGYPGYLCVGPPVRRLGPPQAISSQGTLQRPVDLSPASPFILGSTWYFQFAYFANPVHPNSSDALAVTFAP